MDNKAIELAKYRLERAKQDLSDAKLLIEKNSLLSANNRAYYSIFHAIRVVLALERIDFKRHKDVIAYFNQHYINAELFPKKMGRKISQAQHIREDSDYNDNFEPSYEKTQVQIETAKELIDLVEKYINKKLNNE